MSPRALQSSSRNPHVEPANLGPVYFVGKFLLTNISQLQPTSTYFNQIEPTVIKKKFQSFSISQPICTFFNQILPILTYFNQLPWK